MQTSCQKPSETGADANISGLRRAMSQFATGVVVVSGMDADGEPSGLACQSFTSLSNDPPLVSFCPSLSSRSWRRIRARGFFALSILGEGQRWLSQQFATSQSDKFCGVQWRANLTGAPLLSGALAHIECLTEAIHVGGDHEIVVGRVVNLQLAESGGPLLYFRSSYVGMAADGEG